MRRKYLAIATVLALGLGAAAVWTIAPGAQSPAEAADHTDPPGRTSGTSADSAADIGDLYTFVRGEDVVFVLTLAGPAMAVEGQTGTYDRDVNYQIWVDPDGIQTETGGGPMPAEAITVRFGQNSSGHWGMQIDGFPGQTGMVSGPVEFTNELGTGGAAGKFWAGLRDDPFFFDLTGFGETGSTAELSFMSTRDSFAGANITAIVLSVPNAEIDDTFEVWATTSRITTGG